MQSVEGVDKSALSKTAASGGLWTGISAVTQVILRLAQLAILGRLLSPSDFGLIAMIMVVVGFAMAFSDMGISNAVIHHRHVSKVQLSSLYLLNLVVGLIIFIALLFSSPVVAGLYGEPKLVRLLQYTSAIFLIIPLGQQFQVLLQKNLKFKKLAIIDVCSTSFGVFSSCLAAYNAQGPFSLVIGQVVSVSSKSILLYIYGREIWNPSFQLSLRATKKFLSFGLFQVGERSIAYFSKQFDKLLIGVLLGAEILGFYSVAYQLMMRPYQSINPIITKVAFPVFAQIQNDNDRLRHHFLMVIKIISFILIPIYSGMIFLAEPLISILMGKGWGAAVPILQGLSVLGILYSLGNPMGSLLLAKGRADIGFYYNLLSLFLYSGAVWIGAKHGVMGIVWGLVIITLFVNHPLSFYFRKILINMKVIDYALAVLPYFLLAFSPWLVLPLLERSIQFTSHFMHLSSITILYSLIYAILVYYTRSEFVKTMLKQFKR